MFLFLLMSSTLPILYADFKLCPSSLLLPSYLPHSAPPLAFILAQYSPESIALHLALQVGRVFDLIGRMCSSHYSGGKSMYISPNVYDQKMESKGFRYASLSVYTSFLFYFALENYSQHQFMHQLYHSAFVLSSTKEFQQMALYAYSNHL